MADSFQIESVRKLSRKQLRAKINELLASLETATPEERELISYKADIYIHELDRKRDYWSFVSTRDLLLEIAVILLIWKEITLSIGADRQQAENFKKQQAVLTAMQQSTQDTAAQLKLLKSTTEDMNRGVERNAQAAEASSKTAAKSLVVSERAYVSAGSVATEPKIGEKFKVTNTFMNSGKTPAIELSMTGFFGITRSAVGPEESYREALAAVTLNDKVSSRTIIGPGQSSSQTIESKEPMSDLEMLQINSGLSIAYAFLEVKYTDTFGRHHTTFSCSRYEPERKIMVACRTMNKAD